MEQLLVELRARPVSKRRIASLAVLAVFVAISGGAFALGVFADKPSDPCRGRGDEINAIWNAKQRATLIRSISTRSANNGEEAAQQIAAAADAWASSWRLQREAVCRASQDISAKHSSNPADQIQCLDMELHGFVAAVKVHSVANAPLLVPSPDQFFAEIRSPEECVRLGGKALNKKELENSDDIMALVVKAQLAKRKGEYESALEAAAEAVRLSRDNDLESQAFTMGTLGQVQAAAELSDVARESFNETILLAMESGSDRLAFVGWLGRLELAARSDAVGPEADTISLATRAIATRLTLSDRETGTMHYFSGALARRNSNWTEARTHLETAKKAWETQGGQPFAIVVLGLAQLDLYEGRFDDLTSHVDEVESRAQMFPAELALARLTRADAAQWQGHFDRAATLFASVADIDFEPKSSAQRSVRIDGLVGQATIASLREDCKTQETLDRSVMREAETHQLDFTETDGKLIESRARCLLRANHGRAARKLLENELAADEAVGDPLESLRRARLGVMLAKALRMTGAEPQARQVAQGALEALLRFPGAKREYDETQAWLGERR